MLRPLLLIALLAAGCTPPVALRPSADVEATFTEDGPRGPHLLISDSEGEVVMLTLSGRVLTRFDLGGTLTGVSHARDGSGFWVCRPRLEAASSATTPTLTRYDWSGREQGSVSLGAFSGCRGLDVFADPKEGLMLSVVTINANAIDVLVMSRAGQGTRLAEMGFYEEGFRSGFWGHAMVAEGQTYSDARRWNTRGVGDLPLVASAHTLEMWVSADLRAEHALFSDGERLRGLAWAPDGRLFVVDAAARRIHVLTPTPSGFEDAGTIEAPTLHPAGLSFAGEPW